MNDPEFEEIVGTERCPECGWTTSWHAPDCMAEVPAAEYTVTGRGLMRADGTIVGQPPVENENHSE